MRRGALPQANESRRWWRAHQLVGLLLALLLFLLRLPPGRGAVDLQLDRGHLGLVRPAARLRLRRIPSAVPLRPLGPALRRLRHGKLNIIKPVQLLGGGQHRGGRRHPGG